MNPSIPMLLPQPASLKISTAYVDGNLLERPPETGRDATLPAEGYRLRVTASGVQIKAADAAGEFYAHKTLEQLIRQYRDDICPELVIEDYPKLKMRGVMLDISRDRIPLFADLLHFVDQLAGWKINCFMLYMEHSFAYRDHSAVWGDASPMTAEEIRKLDQFCRERFIRLIPMQNTLGHMLRWLSHEPYRQLAECPDGIFSSWRMQDSDPFSLCPTDPASLQFIDGLLAELLPNFSDSLFMGCCDETYDIGKGRSKAACGKNGKDRVYTDYITGLHRIVHAHNHRLMIHADMLKENPEMLANLPADIHLVDWGYGRNYPFAAHGQTFARSGHPFSFMVSNSNYSSVAGRTYRWRGNIANAVHAALETGAEGIINTEWGDFGHWHNWTLSLPAFAFGAAMGWAPETNETSDLAGALDLHLFQNQQGISNLIFDLGKIYTHVAGNDDTDALYVQFYLRTHRKGEPPLDRLQPDGLAKAAEDAHSIQFRLNRLASCMPKKVCAELQLSLQGLQFAIHCAEAWLDDPDARLLNELQPAEQKLLATEFESWIRASLSLRDQSYRPGGRDAALFWLKRYWETVCHAVPFPKLPDLEKSMEETRHLF